MSGENEGSFSPELIALSEAALNAETLGGDNEATVQITLDDGKPTEAAKPEIKTEETKADAKPDGSLKETEAKSEDKRSNYAKEMERRNLTWDKINQEKVALQQEREKLAKEQEQVKLAAIKSQPFRDEHGHTADAYEAFAKQAEASGDKANADAAMKAAQAVRAAETQAKQQAAAQEHNTKWQQNYEKLATEHPDLKNKDSEMYKETVAVINQHPLLVQDPNGIALAVEAVVVRRMFKDSQKVSEENKSLKEQIETLQKKLSLSSGVAAEPPKGETPFDKLSDKEQRSQLEKMLTEAENS